MATETLRPNGAGDEENIATASPDVAHYLNVDEEVQDDATTRLYSASLTYERDLYNITDHSVAGTITGITVYAVCRAYGGVDQASLKLCVKSGSTVGEAEKTITTDWVLYSNAWAVNPDDSAAWEWADIDALQIGISIRRADPAFASNGTYCTQVYVEVTYTPPPVDPPTVTTQAVSIIVPGGATLNGNITDDGGASISEHGFVWKDGSDPVNIAGADGHSDLGAGAVGAYDQVKTGLAEATLFYLRAYATNSEGDGYGAAVSFTTGQTHSGVVAVAPAAGIEVEGNRLASGVTAIGPALGATVAGNVLAKGLVAVAPSVGIVSAANRIASTSVALTPAVGLSVEGTRLASAVAAIAAEIDMPLMLGEVFIWGDVTIGIEVGVAVTASAIREAIAALGPALGIVSVANYITGGAVAIEAGVDVEAIGSMLRDAGVDIDVASDIVAIAVKLLLGGAAITPAVAVEAAAIALFSGQAAIAPALTLAITANHLASAVVALTPDATVETIGNYITIAAAALAVEASVSGVPTRIIDGAAGISIAISVSAVAMKGIFILLGLSGDLDPGSVLEIDSEKMTFTIDGVNALDDMVGNMFDIPPGDSYIEYDDDEGARTVAVDVTYTPRDA